jgi:hypothetical protein
LADLPKEEIRQALSEHVEEIKKKMENLKIGRKAKTEAGVSAEYIHAIFANAKKIFGISMSRRSSPSVGIRSSRSA